MMEVWFDTPHKGQLKDVCRFDPDMKTWVSRDGWIWPRWVTVIKTENVK